MDTRKKIELDISKLYGYKIVGEKAKAALASKIGGGKGGVRSVDAVLGSKIGIKPD